MHEVNYRWNLRLVTDVSRQPFGPIFRGQAVFFDRIPRSSFLWQARLDTGSRCPSSRVKVNHVTIITLLAASESRSLCYFHVVQNLYLRLEPSLHSLMPLSVVLLAFERCECLAGVSTKLQVLRDVTPSLLVNGYGRFGRSSCLHLNDIAVPPGVTSQNFALHLFLLSLIDLRF